MIVLFGPSGGGGTEDATADFDDEEEEESEEESTDSECDVNRPVSPCTVTFVGANAGAGKSSMRSSQIKRKKVGLPPAPGYGLGIGLACPRTRAGQVNPRRSVILLAWHHSQRNFSSRSAGHCVRRTPLRRRPFRLLGRARRAVHRECENCRSPFAVVVVRR